MGSKWFVLMCKLRNLSVICFVCNCACTQLFYLLLARRQLHQKRKLALGFKTDSYLCKFVAGVLPYLEDSSVGNKHNSNGLSGDFFRGHSERGSHTERLEALCYLPDNIFYAVECYGVWIFFLQHIEPGVCFSCNSWHSNRNL